MLSNWSGYIQNISDGFYPGPSHISFLPKIDLNLNGETRIYPILLFIQKHISQYRNTSESIWLTLMVESYRKRNFKIVCWVWGFHLLMSFFLGSVGKIMEKSGIEELIQTIYCTNAVSHILLGKTFARSLLHSELDILQDIFYYSQH